jgi:hypothetical protein
MSVGNFIKKLIKANALFGGKKVKLAGIPDNNNVISGNAVIDSGTNTITFPTAAPSWLVEGKYFQVTSGGGYNDGALFRVLKRQTNTVIELDTTDPHVFDPIDYSGPITFDGRIWRIINDESIAKESPETGNTIFNVNKFDWNMREDGSGVAQQFVEHYHDEDGLGGNGIDGILDILGEPMFHTRNQVGKELCYNDPKSGLEQPFGPLPVVDRNGNQVKSKGVK